MPSDNAFYVQSLKPPLQQETLPSQAPPSQLSGDVASIDQLLS